MREKFGKIKRGSEGHIDHAGHHRGDMTRSHLVGILHKAATLLGLHGGVINCNEMMQNHVLDEGLDEGKLLMRGIVEGIIIEDKI